MKLVVQAEAAAAKVDASLRSRTDDSASWPQPLDLTVLATTTPRAPQFIVPDWLPAGYATLLAGHGGVGKSAVALHLGVCIAAGISFFGLEVSSRRVLYLSCEDRADVLHWRLARICHYRGIDLAGLSGSLALLDLVGRGTVLWEREPHTGYTLTSAYALLAERIERLGTEVLIVDGVSDTFGGNENTRHEVKRYINALVALMPEDRGAVLLVGHVAKPSAALVQTTEGYSGSTAWHNAVRARWYFYPETARRDEDACDRTGDLILELQKSNLGRTDQSMRFTWNEEAHLFVGREIVGRTASDREHRDRIERRSILKALHACAEATPPIVVPAATTGRRTAFHVLAASPAFPDSLRSREAVRRFWRHIECLRHLSFITETSYRRTNRHVIAQLELTPQGLRQCAE